MGLILLNFLTKLRQHLVTRHFVCPAVCRVTARQYCVMFSTDVGDFNYTAFV
jgi:hypothetical protein